ncbi:MAG: oxidoreductase, partial [Comamonadaceae bacterium]
LDGEADVVAGWKNKAMVAMSKVLPSQVTAEQHRKLAEPGSA